jgi:iron(III) transport system ATP-binding protein
MAEIHIKGLTVSYGDNVAVDGVDIDVADGELLVLLGPSGCGKTTTMRSIAGLETPVSGSIRVGDRVLFDSQQNLNIPASQRNIGMVFQSYAIWPHKTVIDNVAFPLRVKRTPRSKIRGQALEALALVGLTELADRGASKLSGGQMQRVALARSLVMKPQALLLDEPLSNLDAKLRERLRFEIKALLKELGITAVYVTHDQDEALALADRIAVMQDGRFEQIATPVEMYRQPRSLFVSHFLGSSNQFDGTARRISADELEVSLAGSVDLRSTSMLGPEESIPENGSVRVTCTMRPETPEFLDEGQSAPRGANVVSGVVRNVNFMGSVTRYQVALPGDLVLEVVRQERHIEPLDVGTRVDLAIVPADVLVYPVTS